MNLFVFPAVGLWLTVGRAPVSWSGTSVWSVRPALLPLLFLPPFLFLSLPRSHTTRHSLEKKEERNPASWLRENQLCLSAADREKRGEERGGKGRNREERRKAATHLHLLWQRPAAEKQMREWERGRESNARVRGEREREEMSDSRVLENCTTTL